MGESGIAQANRLVGQYRGATLALRQHKGMEEVHAYRIAARRLLALLALWRPLIHEPELERRLTRAVGTLSTLRDAQVYAQHHGGSLRQNRLPRVPLLTGPLARWLARLEEVPVDVDLLPLFRLHLALSLSDALAKTTSLPVGIRAKLRCWHRLRLVLKQARYGMELLTAQGGGDPAWLSMLVSWQEGLGQLQDRRQWLRRLGGETGRGQQRRALKTEIRCQLLQLDCHQAELVALRMALLQSGQ
ncbi:MULTISPECIES: CHAD domain-containing protein [Aeromonas]|uniref:CHAD domain-containing protein n=1 Tax=Aeromonas caviae TaxID=648 RepID=A0AAE9PNM0_AERCA|nr:MULTISPECIES: CHAD domain-containing protein [Aeromonas]MBL0557959.1 CHAD domain-containing protein [Aeromonas caviae]MCR3894695.1 CHAD domain-containing protein [Aeromonas caviae]MCR3929239.1 CHAD domain-containing protein [Aeromonas caviae]MCY9810341.1 CHAD domain-containing protein [Aeromonas caviae]MDT8954025.1 CHAD domain-containing protein [Aeromonas caviae]